LLPVRIREIAGISAANLSHSKPLAETNNRDFLKITVREAAIGLADLFRVECACVERRVGHDHRQEQTAGSDADMPKRKPLLANRLDRGQQSIGDPLDGRVLLVLRLK
jgi:hypothetical protein